VALPVERDNIPLHIVCNTLTFERDGKFLIIKRRPDEVAFPGKWEFPGGKLESGESIKASLIREAKEETNLELDSEPIYMGEYEFTRRDGLHVVGLRFVARAKKGEVMLSEDHTEHAWITLKEAAEYDLIEGLDKELNQAYEILNKQNKR
jgi:8-oxo-dGTP diphosphatase